MSLNMDPRHKNVIFSGETPTAFFNNYTQSLMETLTTVDHKAIQASYDQVLSCIEKRGTVFVAGNGGSAAVANHLCCDWTKGTMVEGLPNIKTVSLCTNVPMMTALANDFSYEEVFSKQLETLATSQDLLIVISASGNSPNIVKCLEVAKKLNVPSIALTGFSGGKSAEMADISIHFAINNYAVVEDCHQIFMQALAQFIVKMREQKMKGLLK